MAEEKKEQKSVIQLEDVNVAYIEDVPISVEADGSVSVDTVIAAAMLPGARNIRENTSAVYPGSASSSSHASVRATLMASTSPERKKAALFESLVAAEDGVNAKHFIVLKDAKEYLAALNAKDPNYTANLVKRTNLFCVDLESKRKFQSPPPEFKIDRVRHDDTAICAEVSRFQQDILPDFRKLTGAENIKKTKERYDLEAFNSRVASPEISIFTIRRGATLLGTFTLNLHQIPDMPESVGFGYFSDLFVAKGLENDADFINQFIGGVFTESAKRFSTLKVLAVMAAAGDPTIPIVKCFNHAKEAGLITPFTRAEQERLGVVAHFTYEGRAIHVLSALPADDKDGKFRNSYMGLEKSGVITELFYIDSLGARTPVPITDMAKFNTDIAKIMLDTKYKELSAAVIQNSITSNGGHSPPDKAYTHLPPQLLRRAPAHLSVLAANKSCLPASPATSTEPVAASTSIVSASAYGR